MKLKFILKIAVLLLCLAVFFLFFSCSRSKPEISFGFISLTLYEGSAEGGITSRPQERLSFFIIADDEDGIENLSELYLYHDREQLRWQLKNEDWETYNDGNVTWIGTRSIVHYNNESFPRGQYRAVLINKGGEVGEK